jgi:hypothetical protein
MNKFMIMRILLIIIVGLFSTHAFSANVVFEDVGFIRGADQNTHSFTVNQHGTYRATLTDFSFPSEFDVLGMSINTSMSELGRLDNAGSFTFDAGPEIVFYANIFGVAQGSLDLGLYGINVALDTAVSHVPLPTSILMLASAFLILGAVKRTVKLEDLGLHSNSLVPA